jgi:hypothetical protein
MNTIHLWPEDLQERDGQIRLPARLELDSGRQETLWYEVPERYEGTLTDDADHFVVALALRMAQERRPVRVHGRVSPSLLKNLEKYLGIWSSWKPERYSLVEIVADDERDRELPSGPAQAVCGFSGGVDSSFTAYRHARAVTTRFPEPLTAGILVQGFDIPMDENIMFSNAFAKARQQLDSLGLELIPVATNFRSLDLDWTQTFATGVASVMMLLGGRFSRGLIALGAPVGQYGMKVVGSNPLTDPLLSSNAFRIIPDGAAFGRPEKIRAIADWPEAMEMLRVCWEGYHKDRNCCECEKCIRTILSFRSLGLGLPPCFDRDVTDTQILALKSLHEFKIAIGYEPIVQMADAEGKNDESWVGALRKAIVMNRRRRRNAKIPILRRLPGVKRRLKRILSLRKDASLQS